jgi:uncharacterized protein (TIGR02271 family)
MEKATMDLDSGHFVPQKGMNVVGSDGEKIGTIDAVENTTFIVRKGLFPQDHYIPISAISSQDDDTVYLNITGEKALAQGFANPTVGSMDTAPKDDFTATTGTGEDRETRPVLDTDDAALAGINATFPDQEDERHRTIEVYEEEVTATTHPVERDVVRVHKTVVEELQTFEVPVTDEEVRITRRRADRDVTDEDHAFEERSIEIRLHGEDVAIEKRARVVEEIDLDKTVHQRTEQITETVRHEEVHIDGEDIEGEDTEPVSDRGSDRRDNEPL